MTLPVAAPRIYVDGMPLIPDDINELFAANVGRKLGSAPLVLPAEAFTKISGAAALGSSQWTGIGVFQRWLPFLPGTLIESIIWGYNRGGSGTMAMTIIEVQPAQAPFARAVGFSASIVAGTGYAVSSYSSATIAAGGHALIPANTAFVLEINNIDAANVFGGVLINTRRE